MVMPTGSVVTLGKRSLKAHHPSIGDLRCLNVNTLKETVLNTRTSKEPSPAAGQLQLLTVKVMTSVTVDTMEHS